ncbi:MAG: helix-turn-helix transcriptional regulator [Clostridia bacterium]|nr:helix-turn-helix transcriptional regulator [Clostridia bacterium]
MAFSDNLRIIRENVGMSQAELADTLGISQKAVYGYEKGIRVPNVVLACCMATALGTTVEKLVNGTDDKREQLDNP